MARPPPVFEVLRRDGPARVGRLRWNGAVVPTPGLLEVSRTPWMAEFRRRWQFRGEESFDAGGLRVSASPRHGADLYLLPKAVLLPRRPRRLVESVVEFREAAPPDGGLYAPGLATPANVAWLAYAGVDLVDDVQPLLAAREGLYLTAAGPRVLAEMEELPCLCEGCRALTAMEDGGPRRVELLSRHNRAALEAELRLVREEIRRGRIRELVEGRVRAEAWQVAALRNLDAQGDYLERRAPVARTVPIEANSMEALSRPEVRRYAARVRERFAPAPGPWVLLPCSARKPYSLSMSHRRFRRALEPWRGALQELVLTSPLGVVPRELERTYPAAHYEAPVTGRWDREELRWLEECLGPLLESHRPPLLAIHFDGAVREVVEGLARKHRIEHRVTLSGEPDGDASLKRLRETLASLGLPAAPQRLARTLGAVADYQFGPGAGELLLRYGRATARPSRSGPPAPAISAGGGQLLATLTPAGLLALTLRGARVLAEARWPGLRVAIDDFVPTGSILAPGVVEADEAIRPGDEVVVEGPRAFGVGRAAMSGWEMARSKRGVAVRMREVEERG